MAEDTIYEVGKKIQALLASDKAPTQFILLAFPADQPDGDIGIITDADILRGLNILGKTLHKLQRAMVSGKIENLVVIED